jgi:hypothetical protein
MSGTLAPEKSSSQPPQFVVYERGKLFKRAAIA